MLADVWLQTAIQGLPRFEPFILRPVDLPCLPPTQHSRRPLGGRVVFASQSKRLGPEMACAIFTSSAKLLFEEPSAIGKKLFVCWCIL